MTSEIGPIRHSPAEADYQNVREKLKSDINELYTQISSTFDHIGETWSDSSVRKLKPKLLQLEQLINKLPVTGKHAELLHKIAGKFSEVSERPFYSAFKEPSFKSLPERIKNYDQLLINIQELKKLDSKVTTYKSENEAYIAQSFSSVEDYYAYEGVHADPSSVKIEKLISKIPDYQSCVDQCRKLLTSLTSLPEEEQLALEAILTKFTTDTLPYLIKQKDLLK